MGAEPRQRPEGFTVWEAMHGASELERSEGWREQRCCLRLLEIEDAELARALHFSQFDWACAPHLGADADGTLPRPLTPLERHTADGAVMGKDKATWAELTPHEVQAAATLGFDAIYWDNGMTPETIDVPWSALQPPLRAAAQVLGYTAKEWNEDGGYEEEPAASVPTTRAPLSSPRG